MRDIYDWCIECEQVEKGLDCAICLKKTIFMKEVFTEKPINYVSKLNRDENDTYQI